MSILILYNDQNNIEPNYISNGRLFYNQNKYIHQHYQYKTMHY
jgi:hypothetical protein